jgi:putative flippase GtrA
MNLELDTAVAEPGGDLGVGDARAPSPVPPGAPSRSRWRSPLVTRVVRYALGSVLASLVSLVTFVLVYGILGVLSPRQSSVAASLAGMVPAYFLNRNWAWGRRGRSHFLKEVLPYLAASVLGLVAAMWSVDAASSHVKTLTTDETLRVTLVAMAYAGTYASLWVLKFLFFNVLFARPHQAGGADASQSLG